jgi:hypothetical protein
MRTRLWSLIAVLILSAVAFVYWMQPGEPPLPPASEPTPTATPVPFAVKADVRRILEDGRRIERHGTDPVYVRSMHRDIQQRYVDIQRRLESSGGPRSAAVFDVMVQAAIELGYSRDQATAALQRALAGTTSEE